MEKVTTMVAELSIKIKRYEAFLDNPLPQYFTPEFLDDFKILPESFYSPAAPERFEEFITRWGTHVVKSVMLGGKFSMKRTAKNRGEVKIEDFQRETQAEFERVTASSYAHKEMDQAGNDNTKGGSVTGTKGDVSGSIAYANTRSDGSTQTESNIKDLSQAGFEIIGSHCLNWPITIQTQ